MAHLSVINTKPPEMMSGTHLYCVTSYRDITSGMLGSSRRVECRCSCKISGRRLDWLLFIALSMRNGCVCKSLVKHDETKVDETQSHRRESTSERCG
jgi:hypothetical protein